MILVTGATGHVGTHLLRLLTQRGAALRALAHSSSSRAMIEGHGVEAVEGDFNRPETLERAMEGCDRVFLLSPPHPDQAVREMAAVDAAGRLGVDHVVALSVTGAERESPSPFSRWHGEIDNHLLASGLPYTILRPSGFMQVHLFPVHTVTTQGAWYGMSGNGAHAYIDAEDVAAVAAEVLTSTGHMGQAYELTGPEAITMPQAATQLSEVLGRHVRYIDVPADQFRTSLADAGLPAWLVEAAVLLYGSIREGHLATVTNVVQQVAGRPPRDYRRFAEANEPAFSSA